MCPYFKMSQSKQEFSPLPTVIHRWRSSNQGKRSITTARYSTGLHQCWQVILWAWLANLIIQASRLKKHFFFLVIKMRINDARVWQKRYSLQQADKTSITTGSVVNPIQFKFLLSLCLIYNTVCVRFSTLLRFHFAKTLALLSCNIRVTVYIQYFI